MKSAFLLVGLRLPAPGKQRRFSMARNGGGGASWVTKRCLSLTR